MITNLTTDNLKCTSILKTSIAFYFQYIIAVTVFFIGEAILIGIMYGRPQIAKDELRTVSLPQFKGLDSSEPITLGWNVVMIQVLQDFINIIYSKLFE